MSQKLVSRLAACALVFVMGAAAPAMAAKSTVASTGLGKAWPATTDVSASPHYHVYVFVRDGVRYIQVNDLNGTVKAAIATNNGDFLVLPIGTDSENVSVPSNAQSQAITSSQAIAPSPGELIYRDNSTELYATPKSNGATNVKALSAVHCDPKNDPKGCNVG